MPSPRAMTLFLFHRPVHSTSLPIHPASPSPPIVRHSSWLCTLPVVASLCPSSTLSILCVVVAVVVGVWSFGVISAISGSGLKPRHGTTHTESGTVELNSYEPRVCPVPSGWAKVAESKLFLLTSSSSCNCIIGTFILENSELSPMKALYRGGHTDQWTDGPCDPPT